jgi:type VI protein secretion system component VasA
LDTVKFYDIGNFATPSLNLFVRESEPIRIAVAAIAVLLRRASEVVK